MRASWNWLRELVDVVETPEEIAERMTLAGLEIEGITRLGDEFDGVVVAEVLERRPHPRADKLTLVAVGDGTGRHDVVCGAPNVPPPGGRVLWARPGARLPGGREIGAKEIKGVASAGMICSERELAIGEDADGIVILGGEDAAAPLGTRAEDALALRDVVFEVNVTANRPDCLGHLGLAREIAALTGAKLRRPDASLDGVSSDREASSLVTVALEDPIGCPRYVARAIEGLAVRPSPRWMRRRLEAVGVRPISNLVDVTNYVMFELGQPLHAFDYDRVERGAIVVRRARPGERMTTLDGVERALVPGDLLICDPRGPVALAGVMGGGGSEVSDGTTRILLESAAFDPASIRRTAKRLTLHSESSHRFERRVDANGADFASARAARLLAETGGGRVARGAVDVYPRRVPPTVIDLRPARVAAVLGMPVAEADITRHLRALELGVEPVGDRLRVTCPTFRPDLALEIDLVEEVARLHGFEHVPPTLPVSQAAPSSSGDALSALVRRTLVAAGLDEHVSYGFTSPQRIAALRFPEAHPGARPLALANPMREEQSVMRTSLVPNLLAALAHNLSFGIEDVKLFEVGHVFLRQGSGEGSQPPGCNEPRFVAGVLCGHRADWLQPGSPIDFTDVKGVVERLLATLRVTADFIPARSEDGFLHPGVAAAIVVGNERVGAVGEVHPETRDRSGVEHACFAFELNLERLPPLAPAPFTSIARFPAIVRDVSFFVDETVPASRVRDVILADRPATLEEVRVLEDYREEGKVPVGQKGMLWSLTYRAPDRTLTDAEVDATHEAIVRRLLSTVRAERR